MGEQKETITCKQVHDSDKYVITRNIVEEVTGEELLKIYHDLSKAEKETNLQLTDIPVQVRARTEMLEQQAKVLKGRKSEFDKHAEHLNYADWVKKQESNQKPKA